ncbi:MAG: LTA synthase family protein [Carboxylicivirga sp.]|jgi:phosphoglycerol transferase MdoB-like AlkP superfamily enzyme|nr:LTA synthase family protein [Carboxylicivirga sp.]
MYQSIKRLTFLFSVLFVIFQLCRILLVGINHALFQNIGMADYPLIFLLGALFDVMTIFLVNTPFAIAYLLPFAFTQNKYYQGVLMVLFVVSNTIAVIANLVDVFYYPYTLKRISISIFSYLGTQANMSSLGYEFFITYWYAIVLLALLLFVMIKFYRYSNKIRSSIYLSGKQQLGVYLLVTYIFVAGCKGQINIIEEGTGFNTAVETLEDPIIAGISYNSAFTLLYSWHHDAIKITNQAANTHQALCEPSQCDSLTPNKNVVIIILESFTSEASKLLNPEQVGNGFTPFLDSLMTESYYFTRASANGRKSMDALPAVLASLPATQTPFILSDNKSSISSLPASLRAIGYETYFFHGSHNATMGFQDFCHQSGINHYYGLDEYPIKGDFDGTWGIWDEPYLQYMANKLNQEQKPFISTVFTLTSHNPFDLPAEYHNTFPKGENGIEETIAYTDHALRSFFQTVKTMDWYKNTLFVITADHAIIPWEKHYATSEKAFSVPLLFFDPGSAFKGAGKRRAQHIDIFPSVLSYLNFPQTLDTPGNNLFDHKQKAFSVSIINECYQLMTDDYLLLNNNSGFVALYDLKNDPLQKHNLALEQKQMTNQLLKTLNNWRNKFQSIDPTESIHNN